MTLVTDIVKLFEPKMYEHIQLLIEFGVWADNNISFKDDLTGSVRKIIDGHTYTISFSDNEVNGEIFLCCVHECENGPNRATTLTLTRNDTDLKIAEHDYTEVCFDHSDGYFELSRTCQIHDNGYDELSVQPYRGESFMIQTPSTEEMYFQQSTIYDIPYTFEELEQIKTDFEKARNGFCSFSFYSRYSVARYVIDEFNTYLKELMENHIPPKTIKWEEDYDY